MLFPYHADVTMYRWPTANWVIIALTMLVSAVMIWPLEEWARHEQGAMEVMDGKLVMVQGASGEKPGVVDYFLLQPGHFKVSQLVGSVLIHEGALHLLGNMLFLWVFGNAICAKMGNLWFVVFYVGTAVFEGTVYLLCGPRMPCLGASGAIMGVVGAFFVLYPRNDVRTMFLIFVRPFFFSISAAWVILFYVAFDMFGLLSAGSGGVAYIAHVAGFWFGAAVTGGLVWWDKILSHEHEENFFQVLGWREKMERELVVKKAVVPVGIPSMARKGGGGKERVEDLPPIEMS